MSEDENHLIAAVTGLRADGPYAVHLQIDQAFVSHRLKQIAKWLIDWQLPHSLRLASVSKGKWCVVEFRFPNEGHARAFEYTFQYEAIALPEKFTLN